MNTVPEQTKNNRGFLIFMSILSGAQIVSGSLVLIDVVPADVAGLLTLLVAAAIVGSTYYMNGKIVPLDNVIAYQPNKVSDPAVYAGGAATVKTGQEVSVDTSVGSIAEKYVDTTTPEPESP